MDPSEHIEKAEEALADDSGYICESARTTLLRSIAHSVLAIAKSFEAVDRESR